MIYLRMYSKESRSWKNSWLICNNTDRTVERLNIHLSCMTTEKQYSIKVGQLIGL